MDHPFKNNSVISYCTGFRGIERGIARAVGSIRTVVYAEIEAFIIQNILWGIEAGMVDAAPIWPNLKTFNARPFRGKIHGIIGGYPCQPFSTAGSRKGTDDPRHLWPYLDRDIQAAQPFWAFFENVAGHLSLGYREVRQRLEELGYIVEEGIFTAQEVGAPHLRQRLFILAIRKDYLQWCKQLAYPYNNGPGNGPGNCNGTGGPAEEAEQWKGWDEIQRERMRIFTGNSRSELVYPSYPGLQRSEQYRTFDERNGPCESYRTALQSGNTDRWPSYPGQPQKNWEAPRTIEPGVGCTINGYNFREDLLRAYGNAVVEQTAELAFRTLLAKHGIPI